MAPETFVHTPPGWWLEPLGARPYWAGPNGWVLRGRRRLAELHGYERGEGGVMRPRLLNEPMPILTITQGKGLSRLQWEATAALLRATPDLFEACTAASEGLSESAHQRLHRALAWARTPPPHARIMKPEGRRRRKESRAEQWCEEPWVALSFERSRSKSRGWELRAWGAEQTDQPECVLGVVGVESAHTSEQEANIKLMRYAPALFAAAERVLNGSTDWALELAGTLALIEDELDGHNKEGVLMLTGVEESLAGGAVQALDFTRRGRFTFTIH